MLRYAMLCYVHLMLVSVGCRGWEKMYVVLTTDSLLFYKDQKHAKAVSIWYTVWTHNVSVRSCCWLSPVIWRPVFMSKATVC